MWSMTWGSLGLMVAMAVAAGSESDQPPNSPKPQPAITALKLAPDEKGLLVGSQAGVEHRTFDGEAASAIGVKLEQVQAFAFTPDGKTLAIAGGTPAEKGIVELRSWPEGKLLDTLEEHTDIVNDVAWLGERKCWATASADRTIRIWDAEKRECRETLKGHSGPVFSLAVSPDGKLLCSASGDQTIRVWKTDDWKPARTLNNHLGAVHALAFQPSTNADGNEPMRLASVSDDGTLRIWQPDIGRLVRIVRQTCPVYAVAWSADGSKILTCGKDGKLRLVEGDSDKILDTKALGEGRLISIALHSRSTRVHVGDAKGQICEYELPK